MEIFKRRTLEEVIFDALRLMKLNFKSTTPLLFFVVLPFFVIPLFKFAQSPKSVEFFDVLNSNPELIEVLDSIVDIGDYVSVWILGLILLNLVVYSGLLAMDSKNGLKVSSFHVFKIVVSGFGSYCISVLMIIPLFFALYFVLGCLVMIGVYFESIGVYIALSIGGLVVIWFVTLIHDFSWIRMKEDISIGAAIDKSFHLIENSWWSKFFVLFIVYLIAGIGLGLLIFSISILLFVDFGFFNSKYLILAIISIHFLIGFIVYQFIIVSSVLKYYDLSAKTNGGIKYL